jgi:hypothetical protein
MDSLLNSTRSSKNYHQCASKYSRKYKGEGILPDLSYTANITLTLKQDKDASKKEKVLSQYP